MRIDFTSAAAERLASKLGGGTGKQKLIYDTEGCGCAVNGVPAMRLIVEPEPGDAKAEGGPFEVWYKPQQAVFFEERLTVDCREGRTGFTLKSDNQIYSTSMRVE